MRGREARSVCNRFWTERNWEWVEIGMARIRQVAVLMKS